MAGLVIFHTSLSRLVVSSSFTQAQSRNDQGEDIVNRRGWRSGDRMNVQGIVIDKKGESRHTSAKTSFILLPPTLLPPRTPPFPIFL